MEQSMTGFPHDRCLHAGITGNGYNEFSVCAPWLVSFFYVTFSLELIGGLGVHHLARLFLTFSSQGISLSQFQMQAGKITGTNTIRI